MRARRLWAAALVAFAVGCSAPRPAGSASARPGAEALPRLWAALGATDPLPGEMVSGLACNVRFGTYSSDYGTRGLACRVNAVLALAPVVAAAPVPVFASGPHGPTAERLGLEFEGDDFGHYNPAFVAWAVETGIPGERSTAVRVATQPVYDALFRRLARVHWLTYGRLEAVGFPVTTPLGPEKDYARYLQGGPLGAGATDYYPGFSMSAFSDANEALPGALGIAEDDLDRYAALYEANTATGFWLRRRADGTLAAFHDGLRRLLATYDASWLADQG